MHISFRGETPPSPTQYVLFRVRVYACSLFFENTPLSPVCKFNTGPILCVLRAGHVLREKYPFIGHFGNMNAVPPISEWGSGGEMKSFPESTGILLRPLPFLHFRFFFFFFLVVDGIWITKNIDKYLPINYVCNWAFFYRRWSIWYKYLSLETNLQRRGHISGQVNVPLDQLTTTNNF